MQQLPPAGESIKEQVVDTVPKRIKELKFGILYVDFYNEVVLPLMHLAQHKTSLIKAYSKSATGLSTTSTGTGCPGSMDLSMAVWAYQARMVPVRPVAWLCSNAMAISGTFGWHCPHSTLAT